MDSANLQHLVAAEVQRRGYWDGLVPCQVAARQVYKLAEELGELANGLRISNSKGREHLHQHATRARINIAVAAINCKGAFDNSELATILNFEIDHRDELVDIMVVVLNMAQAIQHMLGEPFDVLALALAKAQRDAERGVR